MAEMDMLYDANKKSTGLAYAFWFFLGGFGAHRFYLGRTGSAVVLLILTVLTLLTWWFGLGLVTGVVVGIWALIDAFLIPGMAREFNNNLIAKLRAPSSTAV